MAPSQGDRQLRLARTTCVNPRSVIPLWLGRGLPADKSCCQVMLSPLVRQKETRVACVAIQQVLRARYLAVFELVTLESQGLRIFRDRPLHILRKARFAVGVNLERYPDFSFASLSKLAHDRLRDIAHVTDKANRF
jgi:hypothetical protein